MNAKTWQIAPVCLALVAGSSLAWGQSAEFIPIPNPPGNALNVPVAISADGTTVTGVARATATGAGIAFRFVRAQGVSTSLDGVPGPSQGNALSANGSTVVGDLGTEGFLFTSGVGDPYGMMFTTVADVSADGSLLFGNTTAGNLGAFRGDAGGTLVALGGLALHDDTEVAAASADGSIVVATASRTLNNEPSFQAAKKIGDNDWVGLGFLENDPGPGNGNPESYALGISPDGARTVGFSKARDGFGGFTYYGFIHEGTTFSSLRSFFGDFGVAVANDISAPSMGRSAFAVGRAEGGSSTTGETATLWEVGVFTPVDLKSRLIALEPALQTTLQNWQLVEAVAISDNGAWVAGRGINPAGQVQGFMARIAEDDTPAPTCFVDFNDDGFLNQEDLQGYLGVFLDETIPPGPSGTNTAPCPGLDEPYATLGFAADFNRDCNFDQEDLTGYLTEYFIESESPNNCTPG